MMEHYFEIATALLNSEEFAEISGLWQAMFVPDLQALPTVAWTSPPATVVVPAARFSTQCDAGRVATLSALV